MKVPRYHRPQGSCCCPVMSAWSYLPSNRPSDSICSIEGTEVVYCRVSIVWSISIYPSNKNTHLNISKQLLGYIWYTLIFNLWGISWYIFKVWVWAQLCYTYIYYYHSLYMGYIGISQLYKQNLGLRTSSARKTGRMPGLRGEVGGKVWADVGSRRPEIARRIRSSFFKDGQLVQYNII